MPPQVLPLRLQPFFRKIPPCKVLVIGAGVAGLSAIATVWCPSGARVLAAELDVVGEENGCYR
jgi:NAD/NADP transhydrogenase alpha subunit